MSHVLRRLRVAADHTVARALTGLVGDAEVGHLHPPVVLVNDDLTHALEEAFRPVGT